MERTFKRNVRPPSARLPVVDTSKMDLVECENCQGDGFFDVSGRIVDCDVCGATGRIDPDELERGREITDSNCKGW